jgi:hypothetical protein
MWVHQVSAVAIINERHELVAQLSASDLKGFPLHRVQVSSLFFDIILVFIL